MAQSIVKVAVGLVRGESAGGAVVFRGIRYAAALVGADWFRPAQPALPEAARHGGVTIRHVSFGAAAGGYAAACAVTT